MTTATTARSVEAKQIAKRFQSGFDLRVMRDAELARCDFTSYRPQRDCYTFSLSWKNQKSEQCECKIYVDFHIGKVWSDYCDASVAV